MKPLLCTSCKECCKGPDRELKLKIEDWGRYQTYIKGDEVYLDRQDNGDCIYFDQNHCTIYAKRPLTCREFDCREHIDNHNLPQRIKKEAIKRL